VSAVERFAILFVVVVFCGVAAIVVVVLMGFSQSPRVGEPLNCFAQVDVIVEVGPQGAHNTSLFDET
jgi:hypothetical protein